MGGGGGRVLGVDTRSIDFTYIIVALGGVTMCHIAVPGLKCRIMVIIYA